MDNPSADLCSIFMWSKWFEKFLYASLIELCRVQGEYKKIRKNILYNLPTQAFI